MEVSDRNRSTTGPQEPRPYSKSQTIYTFGTFLFLNSLTSMRITRLTAAAIPPAATLLIVTAMTSCKGRRVDIEINRIRNISHGSVRKGRIDTARMKTVSSMHLLIIDLFFDSRPYDYQFNQRSKFCP